MCIARISLIVVLLSSLIACSDDENKTIMPELGDGSELDQMVTESGFTGTILIKKDGKYLLRKAYGYADFDAQRENTLQTRFRIGSLTKAFTGLAMVQLKNAGTIDSFHDPLAKYLTDFPYQQLSLFDLLTMRSGLTDYKDHIDWSSFYTPQEMYELISSLVIKFPAGSEFDYNNSNYTLLGYLIEQLTGQRYIDYLQAEIFDPLALINTEYGATDISGEKYAKGYVGDYQSTQDWDMSFSYASGGLSNNLPDMERWGQFLLDHQLIDEADTQALFKASEDYGFGWISVNVAGIEAVLHDGGLPGFVSIIGMIPKDDSMIIILGNNSDFDINGLNEQIILTQFLLAQ